MTTLRKIKFTSENFKVGQFPTFLHLIFCFYWQFSSTEFVTYPVTEGIYDSFGGFKFYNELMENSRETSLNKLIQLANGIRAQDGVQPFNIDDQLCRVIRFELLKIVQTYPFSDHKPKQINFAYANFTNLTAKPVEFEKEINFICCDKAIRGEVETFIICGFSKNKGTIDQKSKEVRTLQNVLVLGPVITL